MTFSDSAKQQFMKRFTISRISLVEIYLYWDFFATSHGIEAVDVIGGQVNREVSKALTSKKM